MWSGNEARALHRSVDFLWYILLVHSHMLAGLVSSRSDSPVVHLRPGDPRQILRQLGGRGETPEL